MLPIGLLPTMGGYELAVIALVSLLLFGNRLPSVMRSLGKSVTEFKRGMNSIEEEIEADVSEPASKKKPEAVKDA